MTPIPMRKKIPKYLFTVEPFHHNVHNILKNVRRNILSDFQSIGNVVFRRLMPSFLPNCFSVARPSTACIVLLRLFGNGIRMIITQWECHENENKTKTWELEWEGMWNKLTAWEWQRMGMYKSNLGYLY